MKTDSSNWAFQCTISVIARKWDGRNNLTFVWHVKIGWVCIGEYDVSAHHACQCSAGESLFSRMTAVGRKQMFA